MKLHELKAILRSHPEKLPRFVLPDGNFVAPHYHITEVGHVARRFIDCGGQMHETTDTCLLQTYVANDVEHRLTAERFGKILDLGKAFLPGDDLDVEVEYDCCVISQYPIAAAQIQGETLDFHLRRKHTDCLAKKACGIDESSCGCEASTGSSATACC